ncbi:hypothetical protein GE107_19800 [Cohnella sp. CFH 77786]|uniref:MFS transporter n=1 Tax=Cohnella sp. CFH 77786 TaxID=2662265 RepID=UPI001C60D9FD|nr:MFS transporter [Cohnella sp. CFH 77786]MBW5448292.1 hypothetical protein [Cohnella sp. CFH 77786]
MKRFRLLLSGQALSTLGDILYILALVTTLYRQSGSAAVAALFPLLRVIGMTAGSLYAPLALGKFRLGALLAFCLLGQAGGLAALALYVEGAGPDARVEWLTGTVFALSVLGGIAGPARSSILPQIVEKTDLLKANGTLGAVVEACSLAGWAFGAVTVSGLGAVPSLWTSAVLLLAAGGAAVAMRVPAAGTEDSAAWSDPGVARRSFLVGWRTLLRVPALRLVLWMDVWEGLFASAFAGALLLVFARERLHAGEMWWGWMNGAFCAGLILANAAIGKYAKDAAAKLTHLFWSGGAGMAVCVLAFSFSRHPGTALLFMLLIGIFESAKGLASRTLLQLASPVREMPNVFAAQSAVVTAVYGVSLLLTGWMADRYGIRVIYVGAAVCTGIAFLGAFRYRRTIRETTIIETEVHA